MAARPCCPNGPAVVAYVALQAAVSEERLGHPFWARAFMMFRRKCVANTVSECGGINAA